MVGQYAYRAFGLSSDNDTQKMWIEKCIGIVALVSIFALTAFSNAIATKAGTIITMIKIVIVTFVIACGIAAGAGAFSNLTPPGNFANAFEGTTTNPSKYADALYLVFFCYDGWSMLSTSVGELKDPVRNIPRAMVGGLSIVAVLYIGANFSYFLVLTREEIIQSKTLLASVYAEKMFGPTFAKVMSVLIMLSAYGSALCITFGASRVAFASAQRGFLPFSSILSKLHSRFQTPFTAIVFHCLLSLTLILITVSNDAFEMLIAMTGYPTCKSRELLMGILFLTPFAPPFRDLLRSYAGRIDYCPIHSPP